MKLEPRQEQLYTAVSDIDQKYIDEALSAKPRKWGYTVPKRLATLAATLALLLTPWGKIFTPAVADPSDGSSTPVKPQAPASLFAITVSASENEEVDMDVSVGATAYSSVAAEEEIQIEDDQPVFIYNQETGEIETHAVSVVNSEFWINIWPNEHVTNFQAVYYTIQYNGNIVDANNDDHLELANFVLRKLDNGDVVTGTGFGGWFTEPTDLEVNIYSRDNDSLVQTMVFCITPSTNSNDPDNAASTFSTGITGYIIELKDITFHEGT